MRYCCYRSVVAVSRGRDGVSAIQNRWLWIAHSLFDIMDMNAERKSKFKVPDNLGTKVAVNEVRRYITDCITAAGTTRSHAESMANVLLAADTRGHYSHGLNRLEMYVKDLESKICDGSSNPSIVKESVSTAFINGNNTLGPVVGEFSMKLAIKKAKETGVGWVAARGSNHYGIAGYYAMMAMNEGLIGMSFTNSSPLVAPTRSKERVLGTNPLACAAPAANGDSFVLDMATSTVAVGKLEVQRRKNEPIPSGWAIDTNGEVTNDPMSGINGALMPLGGAEMNSGYKGYGLGMMIEVFCGLLAGGEYGPNVRKWMNTTKVADLGQGFVAINPSFFADGFETRVSDLMDTCRNLEPVDSSKPVLVAGDPERTQMKKVEKEGGVTYHINQINDSYLLAKILGVTPMNSEK